MKYFLKYITITIAVFISISCIKEEMNSSDVANSDYVEFIARPTSMTCHDVASGQTKAFAEDLTDIEKRIENAFFLLFAPDGSLVDEYDKLNVENNVIPTPEKKKLEVSNSNLTACFIANVPESFVEDIDHVDDLTNVPLQLTYAPRSETGYIGIPMMDVKDTPTKPGDDVKCFPMIGIYSGKLTKDNTTIQIPLKRLFAKVEVNLKLDMYESVASTLGDLLGDLWELPTGGILDTYMDLKSISVNNFPKKVFLAAKTSGLVTDVITSSNLADADFIVSEKVVYEQDCRIWDISSQDPGVQESEMEYSFTFYVPEYALIPEGLTENTAEAKKPNLLGSSQKAKAIFVSLSGFLHRFDNTSAEVGYNIYLGENNSNSFSVFRNTKYNNNLSITDVGHLDYTDDRVDRGRLNLVEASGDEAANCYIISVPGQYELDAYKGVVKSNELSSATPLEGTDAVVVWNTNTNNNLTCSLSAEDPTKIHFEVNESSKSAIEPGNALIAIRKDGVILWSWHLWFCARDNRPDHPQHLHIYPNTNVKVMNRALGATTHVGIEQKIPIIGDISLTQWTDGLYYQWGRKDPMRLNGSQVYKYAASGNYQSSIQNPDTFYNNWSGSYSNESLGWTSDKSVNDPCPPGYKVPSNSIWRSSESSSTGMEDIMEKLADYISDFDGYPYELAVGVDMSKNIVYPYSSYLDSSANGTKKADVSHSKTITKTDYVTGRASNLTQYRAKQFKLSYLKRWGYLWSSNYDVSLNFTQDDPKNSVVLVDGEKKGLFSRNWESYANQTISGSTVTSNFYDADPNQSYYKFNDNTLTAADGLHVRCVKE